MVRFDSLLGGGSALCAPMVHGSLVFWDSFGSCVRVPYSAASLASVLRDLREWSRSRVGVVSVSFWAGSVLVARAWGSAAVPMGACSSSECWCCESFVS